MPRPHQEVLSATVAGAATALFLVVGRWSPERLLGIESSRYFELNRLMLFEPRQWVLPILIGTVLTASFSKRNTVPKQERATNRYGRTAWNCVALLFLYLLLSAAWAPEPNFALLKAYDTLLTFSVLMIVGIWYRSTNAELFHRSFWNSIVVLTGALMLCALVSLGSGRLAVLGGGPNVFARLMFLFAAGCMGLSQRRNIYQPVLAVTAMGLVVLSGSRGGMLAAAFGALVYLGSERKKISSKLILVTGGVVAGGVLLFLTPLGQRVYDTFSQRIVEQTIQEGYTSEREILFDEAIGIWHEHPIFGTGISGWAALQHKSHDTVSSHPHNLFSEMLCEGGAVAAFLLVMAIWNFLCYVYRNRRSLHVPSLACATMFLMASQFSGDFFDSRGVFLCAMLAAFQYRTTDAASSTVTSKRAGGHLPLQRIGRPPAQLVASVEDQRRRTSNNAR